MAVLVARSYDRDRSAIEQTTSITARGVLRDLDEEFDGALNALRVLAGSRALETGDLPSFYQEAQGAAKMLNMGGIVLVNPRGQQIFHTRRPLGTPLPGPGTPDELMKVFSTGKPAISNLFVGPVVAEWVIGILIPVVIDGKIAYGLGVSILPAHLQTIIDGQKLPPDWVISIIDGNYRVAARSIDIGRFLGAYASSPLVERMRQVRDGTMKSTTLEGISVFAAFSQSSRSGWAVVVGVPSDALMSDLRHAVWISTSLVAGLLAAGVLIAYGISARVGASIVAIKAPAIALASGRSIPVPAVHIREVAEVGEAIEEAGKLLALRTRDREKAEAAEQQALVAERIAARFRTLMEVSPDALVVVGPDANISFVNARTETDFGYAEGELVGQPIDLLIPERLRAAHAEHIKEFAKSRTMRAMGSGLVIFGRRKDGSEFPVEINLAPIQFEAEAATIAAIRDVTHQRKTEEALRQSQKMRAVGQLTGGIAHDFNNMLMVIGMGVEASLDDPKLSSQSRSGLDLAMRAANRCADLINQLLAFSRRLTLSPTVTELGREMADVARLLRQTMPAAITIDVDAFPRPVTVRVDRGQLQTALLNLALNSRDAMKDGGRLQLFAAIETFGAAEESQPDPIPAGTYGVIGVRDTGSGMTDKVRAQALEPFFTTKPDGQGPGLGLSMVYGFVRQSGGYLQVTSAEGAGTCIRLVFPLIEATLVPEDEGKPLESSVPLEPTLILVVEDMDDVRQMIATMLQRLGYRVLTAVDAASALALLIQEPSVDLMLTDIGLPGGQDGVSLANAASERHPTLKIITMSGYNPDEIGAGGEASARIHLKKPFSREALQRALSAVGI